MRPTAQINTNIEERPTEDIETALPLPAGVVEIQDTNGYWLYDSKPEGEQLPDLDEEADHHCRDCGGTGTADTETHAFLACHHDSYDKGKYPCHSYKCIFAGLY